MTDAPMRPASGDAEIRVAIIGYGLAGRVFHAPLVAAVPQMRLVTVVTANSARRLEAERRHPGVRILSTAAEVWEDAGAHDLVVVAAPNRHHVALARASLAAGLHTVVDKPLAPTAAEARALVTAARQSGRLLTVFHNRRADAEILTLRRLIADGVLGDVVRVESRFDRWRPALRGGWREDGAAGEGGGLLLDLGSHLVDQAVYLFGPPDRVYAELARRRPGTAVEDDVFVALHYSARLDVHLWAGMLGVAAAPRLRAVGLRGTYVREHLDAQEEALHAGVPVDARWGTEPPERWGRVVDESGSRPIESERGAWPRFYEMVAAAILGQGPLPVDPEEALTVLQILDAARRSAEGGVTISDWRHA